MLLLLLLAAVLRLLLLSLAWRGALAHCVARHGRVPGRARACEGRACVMLRLCCASSVRRGGLQSLTPTHPLSSRAVCVCAQPPKVEGKDDLTGEPLMKRKDDNEATLRNRLKAFHDQTKPVVDYYAKQGLYSPIDANQKSETVKGVISAILAK